MSETNNLTASILIEIPKRFPNVRLWRQNTGSGVGMHQVREAIACLRVGRVAEAIKHLGRPMRFGVVGGGDLSGVVMREIPGVICSQTVGQRIEIEIKAGKDKQSDEQRAFQAMCERAGALYIIARSVEDVVYALEGK